MHARPTGPVISLTTLVAVALTSLSCDQAIPPNVKFAPVADEVGPPWDKQTLFGYADANLQFWIYPRFEVADMFEGDLARVRENGKWGVIDRNGEYVLASAYDEVLPIKSRQSVVFLENGLWGLMDLDGNLMFEPRFPSPVSFYKSDLAPARDPSGSGFYGYVDKSGDFVIEPKFGYAGHFYGDYAKAGMDETLGAAAYYESKMMYGFIDKNGNWTVPPKYKSVGHLHHGMFTASITSNLPMPVRTPDGEWIHPGIGIANLAGEWVHPPEFDRARILGENHFLLVKDGVEIETDRTPVPPEAFEAPTP